MGYRFLSSSVISRSTRHGAPTAITFGGTSFVTTLPAPITELSPIVIPPRTTAPVPIQTLFPI